MNCNNKISHTCGDNATYAACVKYEATLPEFTKIVGECATIQETTEDTYTIIGDIKEEVNLSELGSNCLEYLLDENDKVVVKNVLLKYEEEICLLKSKVETLETTALCDTPIAGCVIDFSCLELPCDNSIVTFGDWMLAVQNKICEIVI